MIFNTVKFSISNELSRTNELFYYLINYAGLYILFLIHLYYRVIYRKFGKNL